MAALRVEADREEAVPRKTAEITWAPASSPVRTSDDLHALYPGSPAEEPAPAPTPRRPPEPMWIETVDWGAFVSGPRGLALAGGVVSLLGVVFLFALAVSNGWVTPAMRVGFGAVVSVALFAAAYEIMRRYGQLYAATAAVAAAIGGSYITLYAATAMYDLFPSAFALVAVSLIAAVSVFFAARWNSEFVAGLGLISASAAPVAVQHEVTFTGLMFAAVVFAATAALLYVRSWRWLVGAGWGVTAIQLTVFLAQGANGHAQKLAVGAIFVVIYAATAMVDQAGHGDDRLRPLDVSVLLSTVPISLLALQETWGANSGRTGGVLLGLAAVYSAAAAFWFVKMRARSFAALLWLSAIVFFHVGASALLGGLSLTILWAAEAGALFVLAAVAREIRFELPALLYVLIAGGHGLYVDLPPSHLIDYVTDPLRGFSGLLVLAAMTAAGSWILRARPVGARGDATWLEKWLAKDERSLGVVLTWMAAACAAYVAVAFVLQAAQTVSSTENAYWWGQVVITGLLACGAVGLLVAGSIGAVNVELWTAAGFSLGLALIKLVAFDQEKLPSKQFHTAEIVTAVVMVVGAFAAARVGNRYAVAWMAVLMPVSVLITLKAVIATQTGDQRGLVLLVFSSGYAALAAASFIPPRDRSLITLLTAPSLLFAGIGMYELAPNLQTFAVELAAVAALLLLLANAVSECRFQFFAGAFAGGAIALTFVRLTPPSHLLTAVDHPSSGVGALAACVALLALGVLTVRGNAAGDMVDVAYQEEIPKLKKLLVWLDAALALYLLSLVVLELFHHVGQVDQQTAFQRGETAVSASWALIGLVCLIVGLFRRLKSLRVGGLVLLGIALAKLFLFDLANLSSLSRAVSFLAVGAVLLAGGFAYQRLNATLDVGEPQT